MEIDGDSDQAVVIVRDGTATCGRCGAILQDSNVPHTPDDCEAHRNAQPAAPETGQ
jgi:hypothetical protein